MAFLGSVTTKAKPSAKARERRQEKPRPPKKPKPARVRPTSGEKAAVKLALDLNPPPAQADEEQIDWVEELVGPRHGPRVREIRNAIGRPPGARNRRTVEFAEYLLKRYTSPAEGLAQIANMSIEEVVAATGCTRLEALQEKRIAATALLPYLHSKMPVSIDITNRKIIYLHIGAELLGPAPDKAPPQPLQGVGLSATIIDAKAKDAAGNQTSVAPAGADRARLHVREEAGADHQRAGGLGQDDSLLHEIDPVRERPEDIDH